MRRGSALTASAPSFSPFARPSRWRSIDGEDRASAPIVSMPRDASCSRVTGPTPHSSPTGSGSRNSSSVPAATTTSPSGLATCDATLARCLVVAHADRDRQPELGRAPGRRISVGHRRRRPEEVDRPGDVEERLVDRDPLDEGSEVVEHLHHRVAEALVLLEVATGEREAGAELAGAPARPCPRATP